MPADREALRPDAALVARFAARLDDLWDDAGGEARLAVAVSGGPDSTALLLLAAAALPGRVEAATVDHGLRPEAADEAAMVAALCARLDVPHETLRVEVAPGSVQARAREARYAALAGWMEQRALSALATGHHADDQAETLLLRLNRASGVAGLAGVREYGAVPGTQLPLIRPLLDWRRGDLQAIVEAAAVPVAEDPSNSDDRFDRVRMRKAIAAADWLDVGALAVSAANIADADAALSWAARREWIECVREEGPGLAYRPRAPRAVALRVLARMVAELGESEPRGGAVARLFESLLAGEPASIGDLVVRPLRGAWVMTKSPKPRKAQAV
ncbi:MAG: tRNA lysidine(34) synthetase TilS [Sphingomonadaceae bacterium]